MLIYKYLTPYSRATFSNYPSEKELGGLIKDELGEEFYLLNADLVSDSFEREMLDFLKSYDKGKAEFYSWKDAEEFFNGLKGKINTLMTAGLSKVYPEKLRGYEVYFEENLEGLRGFLSGNNQILHLETQSTRLSAIKVLQGVENSDKYKEQESYIFMRLRTLLRQETQDLVIKSFSSDQTHHLLVIECQAKTQGEANEISQLSQKLSTILGNLNKKIILIAQGEDALAAKFKDLDGYENKNDQSDFKDLDEDSQKKMLEKKVNFQGKDISLNELIDKNSAGEIIDQASLSRLLEGEKIQIGDQKAFSFIGYEKDYYIERKFHRQRIKAEVLKEEIGSELFFITGASEENLTKLEAKEKDIHTWENGQTYGKGIILPPSGGSDQEIFQKLGEKVHWLEYRNDNLFWRAFKGNSSALEKYIDKNYASDGKSSPEEKDFSKPGDLGQKVVIIANDSGMGKSTVLTSIAHKMKQENPALWVVRVNLRERCTRIQG